MNLACGVCLNYEYCKNKEKHEQTNEIKTEYKPILTQMEGIPQEQTKAYKTYFVKMLYDRLDYLKTEIADFENCNGGVEWSRLMAIKEQASCIYGLIDVIDKELFKDVIRCEQTNEEWFDSLPTDEKAKIMIRLVNNLEKCELILDWLKEVHKE